MGMFDFMSMYGNYEVRKVDRYENKKMIVDTCSVTDSDKSFETAIQHQEYNNNEWIIVELYDTKKQAQEGHDKWVKLMTSKKLPKQLIDVSTAEVMKLSRACGTELQRVYKRRKK